jgi:hypothetical protein
MTAGAGRRRDRRIPAVIQGSRMRTNFEAVDKNGKLHKQIAEAHDLPIHTDHATCQQGNGAGDVVVANVVTWKPPVIELRSKTVWFPGSALQLSCVEWLKPIDFVDRLRLLIPLEIAQCYCLRREIH